LMSSSGGLDRHVAGAELEGAPKRVAYWIPPQVAYRFPLLGGSMRSRTKSRHAIRTSEHFHVFSPPFECSDVRLGWQETRKRVLELRRLVTVPREICSLGRMNDDRPDLEIFQQCRDLVFGDWTSAPIFVPLRVWIGEKPLHHLLRCYLRAVLGKHSPQCREKLNPDAGFIWSTREVNRRPTGLLGPTTTCMLRNLQRQFPVGTQPIVKAGQLRRLQFLEDTEVVGYPPCEFPPNRRKTRDHQRTRSPQLFPQAFWATS
jgi:hypothetical protein